MAFYTFLEENVDVVIVEVGIGGEHDCTNVLRYHALVDYHLILEVRLSVG